VGRIPNHRLATACRRFYNQAMMEIEIKSDIPDRIIGILGGMGPEATMDLYLNIIRLTPAGRDQDHVRVLIYSNPKIPDRTMAIEQTGDSAVPSLIESAKLLERAGAGIIAMPCNAAHYFLAEIQREINIPILDMIEETSRRLRRESPIPKTIGLLASNGTVSSGVYTNSLRKQGISTLLPGGEDQQKIQIAIDEVKAGTHDRATQETFQSIGLRMVEAGAESVILGCTEIPLAFSPDEVTYPTLNPTRILAEIAVNWALGKGL